MERGIRRQEIFREETDYYIFIAILKNVMEKYGANLHAYCLMTNHIHLLLETYEEKVGKIMQKLAGDYARTFNRRYGYKVKSDFPGDLHAWGCRCKGEGIYITEACMGCDACAAVCPQRCIEEGAPYRIHRNHCLRCGNCYENCPAHAIERK